MKLLLPITVFILLSICANAQVAVMPVSEWIKKLSDPTDKKNKASDLLVLSVIISPDTLRLNSLLQQFQEKGNSNSQYFKIRFTLIKAKSLYYKDYLRSDKASKQDVMLLIKTAMQQANEFNDEYLVAYTSMAYFSLSDYYKEMELSVMYGMYSAELYEKLYGNNEFSNYAFLAEQMYRVREYDKCKEYCLKWLVILPVTESNKLYRMTVFNTLALAYHRTANYDSAMYNYNIALAEAAKNNRTDWKGIISGNMGQVYYLFKKYDTAIKLLETDYSISVNYKLFDNAANALQWAAKANIALGNKTKALQQIWEAMTLIKQVPDEGYLQNIYHAATEVYQANGLNDSAIQFSVLYQKLHDAIEKRINTSSLAISKIRLNEEKNLYNIRRLQQDKNTQEQQRNSIIIGIVLLAVISVLIANRQRLKLKHDHVNLEKEKIIIENEFAAAKLQMEIFTQNIIEKTSLVEKLEQQMMDRNSFAGQQETIAAISNLTILTEQDWEQFKILFEKINPLFFQRLKIKSPDITVAEQRMAALTCLQLTTRQMAFMQGISPDSVHKTRQRLRQRMNISNETNLEEFLCGI